MTHESSTLNGEVIVVDDVPGEFSERVVEAFLNRPGDGFSLVLSGGETARRCYERLAADGADQIDWWQVDVYWGDERCVPPDHPDSNYAMAEAALLARLAERPEVMRMEGEVGHAAGAAAYEADIRERLGGEPRWDLLLLGLGPDAHICSLFPGDEALGERERRVVGVETAGMAPLVSRITLTLPVVNAGRELLFLVTGEDKADAVARAFAGPPDPRAPGSLVRPENGALVVLLDSAAAARL